MPSLSPPIIEASAVPFSIITSPLLFLVYFILAPKGALNLFSTSPSLLVSDPFNPVWFLIKDSVNSSFPNTFKEAPVLSVANFILVFVAPRTELGPPK